MIRSTEGSLDAEGRPGACVDARDDQPPTGARLRSLAVRFALAIAVVVLVFGFALPRMADYGEAWSAVRALSMAEVALVAAVGLFNLVTYWPLLVLTLPGLRWREAAVVNQASTAVANTVPAGGMVAIAVTFRMLRSWGFTSQAIANHVFVTGVWNALVKLGLPILAVGAVASTGELRGSFVELAGWGVAALVAALGVGLVLLRAESTARRLGRRLDRTAAWVLERFRLLRETGIERWLVRLRQQLVALLGASGIGITAAAVVSHLSLYLVLLIALRVTGIDGAHASWAKVLAAFALVRLLSAIPITPGGVGVVELGYVGFLATGAAQGMESSGAPACRAPRSPGGRPRARRLGPEAELRRARRRDGGHRCRRRGRGRWHHPSASAVLVVAGGGRWTRWTGRRFPLGGRSGPAWCRHRQHRRRRRSRGRITGHRWHRRGARRSHGADPGGSVSLGSGATTALIATWLGVLGMRAEAAVATAIVSSAVQVWVPGLLAWLITASEARRSRPPRGRHPMR